MRHVFALALAMASMATLPASAAAGTGTDTVFVFPFFRGNGEHGVFLAVSEDGLRFREVSANGPIFRPPAWKDQNLTRDPSIVFHDGKFRMVWTTGWRGRVFGYAESADLRQWSESAMIRPFPESLAAEDQPENVWAPEIHWDAIQKSYLVLWSSTTGREKSDDDGSADAGKKGGNDHRIYASRSADGKQFSPAAVFFDQGFSVIDAQMALDDRQTAALGDDRWVMVLKHEQLPEKNLRWTEAPADLSKPFAPVSAPIIGPKSPIRPREKAEGATLLRAQGRWLLYWDAFSNGHYAAASSTNLTDWTDLTSQLQMPAGARHGTVFLAPRTALPWLRESDKN